jgi:hypothetical protein
LKGSGFLDEATPAPPLWIGPAALYYLQLLPSRAFAGQLFLDLRYHNKQ